MSSAQLTRTTAHSTGCVIHSACVSIPSAAASVSLGAGPQLDAAIECCLRAVKLWANGVADKPVGSYSGGMKRRLSVAISLMGSPQVVYLDKPSTVSPWLAVTASEPALFGAIGS